MNRITIFAFALLLAAGLPVATSAQQVYRCELGDGSITFSDLPCESDIGREDTVDATPHQGHRPPSDPGEPAYDMPRNPGGGARRPAIDDNRRRAADAAGGGKQDELTRDQRLTLERERKDLLSELKRRHIAESERRAMIRDLREIDRKLGLGPDDVSDMPFHNRDVYEEHNIYPGR